MKRKIFIRTDGGFKLGLGHVMRCLSLAIMLKDEFTISFHIKKATPELVDVLAKKGFDVISILDDQEFLAMPFEGAVVVLDGYHFDAVYQHQIRASGAFLICIDDLHDKEFLADIIINQAPGITEELYCAEPYTRFLLGPEYALLRPAFQRQASAARRVGPLERVLVCFGGSDALNLTIPTLTTLLEYSNLRNIVVVTGSAYANSSMLESIAALNKGRVTHHHDVAEEALVEDMLDVQLAIVPASGILLEVIACKTPAISGYYVDNQIGIYQGFRQRGVFYDAGDFETSKLRQAMDMALSSDPDQLVRNQAVCIDGKSADRYMDVFNKLYA